jgi:sialidase-1
MLIRQIIFPQKEHAFYHVPSLVVAPDGSILAFCEERWRSPCDDTGECHIVMKKSMDTGVQWSELIQLRRKEDEKYHMGAAAVSLDGSVLLMCGGGDLKSTDNGETWQDWKPEFFAPKDSRGGIVHGSGSGVVLSHGDNNGRILWPARTIVTQDGYDDLSVPDRQAKCYSMALYSDDNGTTIHSSNYFHQGTGEACLAENLDGEIYFNARAYWNDNKRRTAVSMDGGNHFSETSIEDFLQEPPQGCNASLVRYPPHLCKGRDILLFANPDTKGNHREHGVVHVSFDGGRSWPHKKKVTPWGDWFDYSAMTVARDGTILLMYKTTPTMTGLPSTWDECASMALVRFDLEWLGLVN